MNIKTPFYKKPVMIEGPCSAESQEQLLATAKAIQSDLICLELVFGNHVQDQILLKELANKHWNGYK